MKVFGNSMRPIIQSGALLTFEAADEYDVGDIDFSKVKGRIVDAHKITKKNKQKGYMIYNNNGYDNGWTHTIFGKVTHIEQPKRK